MTGASRTEQERLIADLRWFQRRSTYVWANLLLVVGGSGLTVGIGASPWREIGTGLLTSGLVGLVFLYELRVEQTFDNARKLYDEFGLLSIAPVRGSAELYRERMQDCRGSFDIIGHSLSRMYLEVGEDTIPGMLKRGVAVRILLMDPEIDILERVADEMGGGTVSPEKFADEIRDSASRFRELISDACVDDVVRLYTATPMLSYQRIDDVVFVGPYFVGKVSSRQPALVLQADSKLAKSYQDHFDNVWEHYSTPISTLTEG